MIASTSASPSIPPRLERPDLLVECLTDAFDSYVTAAARRRVPPQQG